MKSRRVSGGVSARVHTLSAAIGWAPGQSASVREKTFCVEMLKNTRVDEASTVFSAELLICEVVRRGYFRHFLVLLWGLDSVSPRKNRKQKLWRSFFSFRFISFFF